MFRFPSAILIILAAALAAPSATGQPADQQFSQQDLRQSDGPAQRQPLRQADTVELELVDEGVGDADSLSTSLRRLQPDPRAPYDFDRLYRVPGRSDLLMRRQGAITAVFPESRYAASKRGVFPLIPPGTIFHIGAFDPASFPGAGEARAPDPTTQSPNRVDGRASLRYSEEESASLFVPLRARGRVSGRAQGRAGAPPSPGADAADDTTPTMWTDESYRRSRLRAILTAARGAEIRAAAPNPAPSPVPQP